MKLARAFAARQQADTVSEQTTVSAPADNRHQVCQEANVDCTLRGSVIAQEDVKREDEWFCGVCYEEICHPYTLPCGHTICGKCLEQLLLRDTKCPFCRISVFRGCTFGRNIAMWNAIQARHPEQAAALPETPPVVTVQRRLQQASTRHQAPGVQASAAAGSPGQPASNLVREVMTALQQDPIWGRLSQTSPMASDGLGMFVSATAHASARAARRVHMYRPPVLGAARLGHPAAEQLSNVPNVAPVLPHSTGSFSYRSSPNHGLRAESILAATHAADARTLTVPIRTVYHCEHRPTLQGVHGQRNI